MRRTAFDVVARYGDGYCAPELVRDEEDLEGILVALGGDSWTLVDAGYEDVESEEG